MGIVFLGSNLRSPSLSRQIYENSLLGFRVKKMGFDEKNLGFDEKETPPLVFTTSGIEFRTFDFLGLGFARPGLPPAVSKLAL